MIAMILFLKSIFTIFIAILVWVYWKHYGPANFLWMSDIGLFMTLAAIWLESPFLISLCIAAFLPMELMWNIDFIRELLTGKSMTGVAHYMFDRQYTLILRSLSLFHIIFPPLWLWLTLAWGYDARVLPYAITLVWAIFIATYLCTDPKDNINWVFAPPFDQWKHFSGITWLIIILIAYPLIACVPTYFMFTWLF